MNASCWESIVALSDSARAVASRFLSACPCRNSPVSLSNAASPFWRYPRFFISSSVAMSPANPIGEASFPAPSNPPFSLSFWRSTIAWLMLLSWDSASFLSIDESVNPFAWVSATTFKFSTTVAVASNFSVSVSSGVLTPLALVINSVIFSGVKSTLCLNSSAFVSANFSFSFAFAISFGVKPIASAFVSAKAAWETFFCAWRSFSSCSLIWSGVRFTVCPATASFSVVVSASLSFDFFVASALSFVASALSFVASVSSLVASVLSASSPPNLAYSNLSSVMSSSLTSSSSIIALTISGVTAFASTWAANAAMSTSELPKKSSS